MDFETSLVKRWLRKLRKESSHFRSDADLADEMRVHLEMTAEDRKVNGTSQQEARRLARLECGDTRVAIENVRDLEWITAFEGWFRDIVSGARALKKSPLFFFTAVLTLAFGIGANTAIFSFLYGLVLRSLPTRAPAELVQVGLASTDNQIDQTFVTHPMLVFLQKNLTSYSQLSCWTGDSLPLESPDGSLRGYSTAFVTGNAFEVVSMRPYLGRLIEPFDDVRNGSAEDWPVVLSYGFWSDRFGKDPAIIGKQIRISGTPATVVGVTPPGFAGVWPGMDVKMYLPLAFANVVSKEDVLDEPNSLYGCSAIGRLRPGASIARASAEASRLKDRLIADFIPPKYWQFPFFKGAFVRVRSVRSGLPTYITHTYSKPLFLMQGLVALVLLLCCVNVGGLMMSKVYSRQREFAVRTALGAPAWRLVRQYLTESFLIAVTGSALGALFAWRGCDLFLHFFRDPMMGESMQVHPDRSLLAVAAFLAVLVTLLFGALPAWRAGHADPGELLKSRTSLGGKRHIAGRTFVPVQVALSLVLVVLASLLSQSILKLRSEHTGFDTDHVTIQTSPLNLLRIKNDAKLNLYQRMVDRLMEMPGVRSAAVTSKTPMTGEQVMSRFQALATGSHQTENVSLAFNEVGPGYFRTMKTPIVSGREFTKSEHSLNVCILNESAAAFLFPQQQALGQYVKATDEAEFRPGTICHVVGIAANAKFSDVRQAPPHTIYLPLSLERFNEHLGNLVFLINANTKSAAVAAFRQTISELAPTVPLVTFVTLREQMDAALGSQELITLLSNFFGLVALLLSALGLYGLLSASVVQRTAEIGMRIALGADRRLVLRMILREALEMFAWGMLGGAIALVCVVRFVASMLHGVSSFDPLTLAAVAGLLISIAFAAALFPALRAALVDPIEALRVQ